MATFTYKDTYRFDVSGDEIRRYLRDRIKRQSYPPEMALLEPETVLKLRQFSIKP